jgi:hypothetical protein
VRLGVFVAILATLLFDIGLLVPIAVDTAPQPGSERLPLGSRIRCLRFSNPEHPFWPDSARLDTAVANGPPELLWYRGSAHLPSSGAWVYRQWRPSGPDSIDLDWYGSYIRLPVQGARLVGRTFNMYYDNLLEALRTKHRQVVASWIKCPRGGQR